MMTSFGVHLTGLLSRGPKGAKVEPEKPRYYKRPKSSAIGTILDGKDPDSTPSAYCGVIVQGPYAGSPCSALPPELLSLIFLYAKPKRRVAHKIPFEVSISHVCKFWRGVALGTPLLWNRIDVYSKRSKAWVLYYLARSAQRPLDVYIDIYRSDRALSEGSKPMTGFASMLKEFFSNIHRLRLFSLICYRQTTAIYWQSSFGGCDAPLLQSFSIRYGSSFSGVQEGFGGSATLLEGGPLDRLTFLETDTPNVLPPPASRRNLTTLYLHGIDSSLQFRSDEFIQTFEALPSLVNLSLQGTVGAGFWPTGMPLAPQFTLNKLKALRLLDGGGLAIRMLLAVTAEHLESLWLDCSYDNFSTHLFDAPQFNNNRPKFPNLKHLTLVMGDFTMSSRFAKIFPTITHLHFHYAIYKEASKLFHAFTESRWSSLRVLVFSAFREKDAQELNEALRRILCQRIQDNNPMSKILLDKDHLRFLDRVLPVEAKGLYKLVEFDVVRADNYPEYWWNTFRRNAERPFYCNRRL